MVFLNMPYSHPRDFTLGKYRKLCRLLKDQYTFTTVSEYLSKRPDGHIAILRHDVDRKINNALKMAESEYGMSIHSTYYFRFPYTFNPEAIRKINGLGHETGYHYEVLSKTKGDYQKAIALFQSELETFRKVSTVDTICMHGQPLSSIDNRDLWKKYDFHKYGIKGEAYLSIGEVNYFTDTGRSWSNKNNVSDFIGKNKKIRQPATTDDLMRVIQENEYPVLYLTIHPERWADSTLEWIIWSSVDFLFNQGKRGLSLLR